MFAHNSLSLFTTDARGVDASTLAPVLAGGEEFRQDGGHCFWRFGHADMTRSGNDDQPGSGNLPCQFGHRRDGAAAMIMLRGNQLYRTADRPEAVGEVHFGKSPGVGLIAGKGGSLHGFAQRGIDCRMAGAEVVAKPAVDGNFGQRWYAEFSCLVAPVAPERLAIIGLARAAAQGDQPTDPLRRGSCKVKRQGATETKTDERGLADSQAIP